MSTLSVLAKVHEAKVEQKEPSSSSWNVWV